jgi:cell division protein FtsW
MVFTGLALGIVLSVSRGEQDQNWEQSASPEKSVKEKQNVTTEKVAA